MHISVALDVPTRFELHRSPATVSESGLPELQGNSPIRTRDMIHNQPVAKKVAAVGLGSRGAVWTCMLANDLPPRLPVLASCRISDNRCRLRVPDQ